jgi:hypothetical protein
VRLLYGLGREVGSCWLAFLAEYLSTSCSWLGIVPLPPLFHYSDESAASVEMGEKAHFIVLEGVKGQVVTIFVSRRTAAVEKGIPAVASITPKKTIKCPQCSMSRRPGR